MKLTLSIAFASNPRVWPVLDGRVKPDGIDLVCNVAPPSEIFWRQLKFADWDVAEMSMSSLMATVAKGDRRFIGLPIFTTRRFFHAHMLVRRDSGIEKPQDLKDKRVGVSEYQQTAALWVRGALQHEFGVSPTDFDVFMERTEEKSHGGATGFTPPPGVRFNRISPETNIGEMMIDGRLDAAMHYRGEQTAIARSSANLRAHPAIKHLFADPTAEGVRYFKKTGLYPINHGMVVKREIAERHPWVVLNLVRAFEKAGAIVDAERAEHAEPHIETGLLPAAAREALRQRVIHHGIAANRVVLETAARYSHEQGLTPRVMQLEELFAPAAMET